jgi:predicted HAD superfamily Cof-like phosphohydrolase
MEELIKLVAQFHKHFDLPKRNAPTTIPESEWRLRHEIMREENEEYAEACQKADLVAIADALGDQLYVLCGTILSHGLQDRIGDIAAEIHRSNMSKLDADGKPVYREDGKVLKSHLYTPPDLSGFLID